MKKIIYWSNPLYVFWLTIVLLLLLVSNVEAGHFIRKVSAVGGDDCDSGTLKFSWHMESTTVTVGTPAGCSDGDATATQYNSISLDGTQKSDGDYSAQVNKSSGNGYYQFSVGDSSSEDLVAGSEGKIVCDVYIDTYDTNQVIFKVGNGSGEYFFLRMRNSSSDIEMGIYVNAGGNVDQEDTAGSGHTEDEWLRVTYQWDVSQSSADHKITLCDLTLPDSTSNCTDTGAVDSLSAWSSVPTYLAFGDTQSAAGTTLYYIDNCQIYGESDL